LDAGQDKWIADASVHDEIDRTADGRLKGIAQRQKFAERCVVPLERHDEIDVGSLRIKIRTARCRAEDSKATDAEAAAESGDLRPAFGDQGQHFVRSPPLGIVLSSAPFWRSRSGFAKHS
jgi:hypothetical protein